MNIVYKVCKITVGGLYLSVNCADVEDKFILEYTIGKETKAQEPSLIFCFDDLECARDFASKYAPGTVVLLECETSDKPVAINHRLLLADLRCLFDALWKDRSVDKLYCCLTPAGTVGVASLTPVREIAIDPEEEE